MCLCFVLLLMPQVTSKQLVLYVSEFRRVPVADDEIAFAFELGEIMDDRMTLIRVVLNHRFVDRIGYVGGIKPFHDTLDGTLPEVV